MPQRVVIFREFCCNHTQRVYCESWESLQELSYRVGFPELIAGCPSNSEGERHGREAHTDEQAELSALVCGPVFLYTAILLGASTMDPMIRKIGVEQDRPGCVHFSDWCLGQRVRDMRSDCGGAEFQIRLPGSDGSDIPGPVFHCPVAHGWIIYRFWALGGCC